MSESQDPEKATYDSELPRTEWEKNGRFACFHPMTKEESNRYLKWLTCIFIFLFLLLLVCTRSWGESPINVPLILDGDSSTCEECRIGFKVMEPWSERAIAA